MNATFVNDNIIVKIDFKIDCSYQNQSFTIQLQQSFTMQLIYRFNYKYVYKIFKTLHFQLLQALIFGAKPKLSYL